jgi:hypothetical protein
VFFIGIGKNYLAQSGSIELAAGQYHRAVRVSLGKVIIYCLQRARSRLYHRPRGLICIDNFYPEIAKGRGHSALATAYTAG